MIEVREAAQEFVRAYALRLQDFASAQEIRNLAGLSNYSEWTKRMALTDTYTQWVRHRYNQVREQFNQYTREQTEDSRHLTTHESHHAAQTSNKPGRR